MLATEGLMRRVWSGGWLADQAVAGSRLSGQPHGAAGSR